MESGEHAPRPEDVPLPDDEEIGLHEDDPLEINPEDVPLPEDDLFETTSYNYRWTEFLSQFETLKINEDKMRDDSSVKNLPTLKSLRENTISRLKEMREDIFENLYEKYFNNETERKSILANKDNYKPFDTENEEVKDFLELSKNITQLEKEIYTEKNKELMFVLGKEETTPTKNLLRKILDDLNDKKYSFIIIALTATLLGLFVDLEKELNKAKKWFEDKMAEELTKHLQNEFKKQLLELRDKIIQGTKDYLLHIVVIISILVIVYYKIKFKKKC